MSRLKRFLAKALKILAYVAGVVFVIAPLNSSFAIELCIGSALLGVVAFILSKELEDEGAPSAILPRKPDH